MILVLHLVEGVLLDKFRIRFKFLGYHFGEVEIAMDEAMRVSMSKSSGDLYYVSKEHLDVVIWNLV